MSEIAIRRQFLLQADQLVKQRSNIPNIVATVTALEAVVNTMTDLPMRLLLVTAGEAKTIADKTGIDV